MNKIKLLVVFLLASICALGQTIQVIEQNGDNATYDGVNEFHYIDKRFDISGKSKLATINGICISSYDQTVIQLFKALWDKANQLGANAYRIEDFNRKSLDTLSVTITIFNLSEDELVQNYNLYPRNLVYVYGNLDKKMFEEKTILFNGDKIKLSQWEYVSYLNEVGKDAVVSIGGRTGAEVWIRGIAGRLPKHLSLSGFSIKPVVGDNFIGLGANTGRIYPVDLNIGQFLSDVLIEKRKINYSTIPFTDSTKIINFREMDEQSIVSQPVKLIFYRRGKNEFDKPFNFVVNDSLQCSFVPSSYLELDFETTDNLVVICYKDICKEPLKVKLSADNPIKYIECSMSGSDNIQTMQVVNEQTGEYHSQQAKYYQDKRNKKK